MFLGLLLILPASIRAADDPAALRTARERLMGPLIATAPDYTVHSPHAEKSGSGHRCAAGNMNAVTLYLQHTPSDPNRTLVPLAGIAPDPVFVADLNRILGSFLSTCPDSEWVTSAHYYRDAIPSGMAVTDKLDPHIIAFRFVLRGGSLSLKPPQHVSEAQRINNDPTRNPRLTLAGLRAENAAIAGESARRSGEYRAAQTVASGRQPGIVYRLDPYWAQYRRPELARRIFDGDFGLDPASAGYIHGGVRRYADTTDFRFLFMRYADLFSERCAAQVESWATLAEQTRVNHRSELNPVTGIFEARSDPETVTRRIDARFASLYPGYEDDLLKAEMAGALEEMKAADRGERRRPSEMSASDMASTVAQQMSDMMDRSGVFPEFFDNHACTSATVTQMGENILRAAHGRPSLQAAGVKLANAAAESDPPPG